MDFIESWFHVAPDGGDGSLELLYLALLAAAVTLALLRRRIAGRWASRRARSQE
ncbi:MAG TPA: hypothetical protein VIW03_01280 [Anaeromyxobacter sp.]